MKDVLLLAASGLAREVLDADHKRRIVGILDDDPVLLGRSVGGVDVIGSIDLAAGRVEDLVLCVGRGSARRSIVGRLTNLGVSADRYTTIVDASVRVPASCSIGRGTIVLAGTILTSSVTVGDHVVLMPTVVLTHDDVVHDFATLAAGVTLGGHVTVGPAAYLGMGASVRPHSSIGVDATLGMGSVLLGHLPDNQVWAGVPAGPLKSTDDSARRQPRKVTP